MSEDRPWSELLREVGSKAKAEVKGERAEELKRKLRQARDDITRALNSEDAQRVQAKLEDLGSRAEEAARTCLALPIFPELEEAEIDFVIEKIQEFFK